VKISCLYLKKWLSYWTGYGRGHIGAGGGGGGAKCLQVNIQFELRAQGSVLEFEQILKKIIHQKREKNNGLHL